ncbi:MAG: DUF6491 family protein [Thalassotalea sp.]|nr:DUF6491 family protein [Thalassotalea sp.]
MKSILVILTTLILLASCSSNNGMTSQAKNTAFKEYLTNNNIESVKRVSRFRFQGWTSLTDEFLILSSSHKRKFLIELSGFCSDIRWTNAIILNRLNTASLNALSDSISTIETPQINCRIKTIYPLTQEQLVDIRAIDNPKEVDVSDEYQVTEEQPSNDTSNSSPNS